MRIIEEFYEKLYVIKLSKDFMRNFFLNYFNKRIIPRITIRLSTSITMNEMKMIIQRAILKKSLENGDLPFKYYKRLIFRSKKKKKNRDHSLMIKRLIN